MERRLRPGKRRFCVVFELGAKLARLRSVLLKTLNFLLNVEPLWRLCPRGRPEYRQE